MRLLRRALPVLAGCVLLGYGGVMAKVYWRQESLLFHPEPLPADFSFAGRYAPEQAFEERRIAVDGAELSALLFRQPDSRGLVFFLHGNSGNLSTWTSNVDFYRRLGFDLFMLDYRGFGKSGGHIESEAQLHADVQAAWKHIAPAYAGRPIAVIGRSLGSGLAVHLARSVQPELLVLVTPYASLSRLAREQYPYLPTDLLLKYPLSSAEHIGEVRSPILIAYAERDALIPEAHVHALLDRARGSPQVLRVAEAGHGDIHLFPGYLDGLAARLRALGGAER